MAAPYVKAFDIAGTSMTMFGVIPEGKSLAESKVVGRPLNPSSLLSVRRIKLSPPPSLILASFPPITQGALFITSSSSLIHGVGGGNDDDDDEVGKRKMYHCCF